MFFFAQNIPRQIMDYADVCYPGRDNRPAQ